MIIQFDSFGNQIQPGASLEIPRNSTVEALNLGLTYNSSNSPGNIWLDMNEDGTPEYGYNGTGYGHLGNQTRFLMTVSLTFLLTLQEIGQDQNLSYLKILI